MIKSSYLGLGGARETTARGSHHIPELGGSRGRWSSLMRKVAKMTENRNFGDVVLKNHDEIGRYQHIGVDLIARASR